jgi:hypothetical protein
MADKRRRPVPMPPEQGRAMAAMHMRQHEVKLQLAALFEESGLSPVQFAATLISFLHFPLMQGAVGAEFGRPYPWAGDSEEVPGHG